LGTDGEIKPKSLRPWNADSWHSGPYLAVPRDKPLVREIDETVARVVAIPQTLVAQLAETTAQFPGGYPEFLSAVMELTGTPRGLLADTWNLLSTSASHQLSR
jgi:hypothetical protein